jgi:hypothetical protein
MATYFIKVAQKMEDGVLLTGMVMKGVLKDTMKMNIEGKALSMERMGRRNAKTLRVEWLKEVKEKEIVQLQLKGVDFEILKKYQGKNVEFT